MAQRRTKGGESTGGSIRAAGRTRAERAADRARDARVHALAFRLLAFAEDVVRRGQKELAETSGRVDRELLAVLVRDAHRLVREAGGESEVCRCDLSLGMQHRADCPRFR